MKEKEKGAVESMSKICVAIGERMAGRKIGRLRLTARAKAELQAETAEEGIAVTGCSAGARGKADLVSPLPLHSTFILCPVTLPVKET